MVLVASPTTLEDVTEKSGIRFHADASRTSRKYLIEAMVGASPCWISTAMAFNICTL
jgi:hypothetical protein